MLKPSMQGEVTKHIFTKKFRKCPIFKKYKREIGRLLPRIVPIHFYLDDLILVQYEEASCFYFIV